MSTTISTTLDPLSLEGAINFCKQRLVPQLALASEPLRCLVPAKAEGEYQVVPYISGKPYIAISYTWPTPGWTRLHNSNQSTAIHHADRKSLSTHVSGFVHSAVQAMLDELQNPEMSIWVDHECINQSDESEKNAQVAIMDKLYSRTQYTAILLEDVELSTEELEFLKSSSQWRDDPTRYTTLIKRILAARWFTRAWCSQEMILSRASIVFVHHTGQHHEPIRFSYTLLATWVTKAAMLDANIKRLVEPRGLSPPNSSMTMHTIAWAWGLISNLGCYNEYDKISLVLNLTRGDLRMTNVPSTHGQAKPEDRENVMKILNVLAIRKGDVSLLLAGHSRAQQKLMSTGFGWTASPIPGDITSDNAHPKNYHVAKDKMPRLSDNGLVLTGYASTVINSETWCFWRENLKLFASKNGVETLITTDQTPIRDPYNNPNKSVRSLLVAGHLEFDPNPNLYHLHSLYDVLRSVIQLGAKHLFRCFVHPDDDGKLTSYYREFDDLYAENYSRFSRVTEFHRALEAQLNLIKENGRIELLHLKLANGDGLTVFGNVADMKNTTIFQPHGVRPLMFWETMFTVNALVLDGPTLGTNDKARRCVGKVRCFQMLPDDMDETCVTVV